ncbi:MAG: hypothetical protein KIT36_11335 [Alphaproteobacteria bacterium]|nr:hypothetical protein [Alphaproteobacteria bacterium]
MRWLLIFGIVLVAAGVMALVVPHVVVTDTKHVLDAGPISIEAKEQRVIPIPMIAGVTAVVAGLGCVFMARRRA